MKKKKLFVWAYTHDLSGIHVCALDEDGNMIYTIFCTDYKETIKRLFADNEAIQNEWNLQLVDQPVLEEHMYKGAPRETLPLDFRMAWDKYKLGEGILG